MLNRIVTVEECDARDDDSSNAVDKIKSKKIKLKTLHPICTTCV